MSGRRRRDNEGQATPRVVGAAHEIELPAGGAELMRIEELRVHLAHQVAFNHRIDRYDIFVLSNHPRIIDVVRGPALYAGIVVDQIVGRRTAHRDIEDALAGVGSLAAVGDCAASYETCDAIAEQFGVNAKILPILECSRNDVRHPADAELHASTVLDHRQHLSGDALVDMGWTLSCRERDLGGVLHDGVYLRDVNHAGAKAAWQARIYFNNEPFGPLQPGKRVGAGKPKAEPAGTIHRRHLQQEDIRSDLLADNP